MRQTDLVIVQSKPTGISGKEFWGHKGYSSRGLPPTCSFVLSHQSKICQLYDASIQAEDVGRLDVSVNDVVRVQVLQTSQELPSDTANPVLLQRFIVADVHLPCQVACIFGREVMQYRYHFALLCMLCYGYTIYKTRFQDKINQCRMSPEEDPSIA